MKKVFTMLTTFFYTTITNKNLDKTKMVTNPETHRALSQSSMEC